MSQLPETNLPDILIVEDNAVNLQIILQMLKYQGYNLPDTAKNGLDALHAVQEKNYDIIFMDVRMPKMDGIEATKEIRESIQQNDNPWIIALTADAHEEVYDKCCAAGMNDFLNKPLDMASIKGSLERFYLYKTEQILGF